MHPEEGNFTLQLPIQSTTALHSAAFDAAQKAQPQPLAKASAQQQAQVDGDALQVRVAGLPAALRGKTLDLFPEMPEVLHNAAEGTQRWEGDVWTARIPLAEQRSNSPSTLPVVLAERVQGSTPRPGYRADLTVQGPW